MPLYHYVNTWNIETTGYIYLIEFSVGTFEKKYTFRKASDGFGSMLKTSFGFAWLCFLDRYLKEKQAP